MKSVCDTALKELSAHNYSALELRRILEKKFASLVDIDDQIATTLARLCELHLLNDAHVAESLSNRYAHKGNRFITLTLRYKGIPDEIIEETLAGLGLEKDRAIEVARKKIRSAGNEPPEVTEIKLVRFLSSRGFSADTLKQAIYYLKEEELLSKDNPKELLC
ncbi:MAG: regulatory protein RecX [Tatlockia sp.]|nr:regulatory protein RecX [Tatlockia sp.]